MQELSWEDTFNKRISCKTTFTIGCLTRYKFACVTSKYARLQLWQKEFDDKSCDRATVTSHWETFVFSLTTADKISAFIWGLSFYTFLAFASMFTKCKWQVNKTSHLEVQMIQSEEYPRCHQSHWTASSFYSRGTEPGPVKSLSVALCRYYLLPWQLRESTCYPHSTTQTSLPRLHDHSLLPVDEREKQFTLEVWKLDMQLAMSFFSFI